ncbi:hypothetical protein J3R83DRAFT_4426 [Lanmaoa asiatica]|nr:hypothetical protein J3R83DRAFT_4426 [Lanmaoa asiatica]
MPVHERNDRSSRFISRESHKCSNSNKYLATLGGVHSLGLTSDHAPPRSISLCSPASLLPHFKMCIDDAALFGLVIPRYLPSTSNWNIGNNCEGVLLGQIPRWRMIALGTIALILPLTVLNKQSSSILRVGSLIFQSLVVLMCVRHGRKCSVCILHHRKQCYRYCYIDKCRIRAGRHRRGSVYAHTISHHRLPVQCIRYVNEALTSGAHTVMIQPAVSQNILVLFDYLIYRCVLCLAQRQAVLMGILLARICRVLSHHLP